MKRLPRRRFLQVCGAASLGLAGCTAFGTSDDARFPSVDAELDDLPSESRLAYSATTIEEFSEESPARIEISVTNAGGEKRRFGLGNTIPFASQVGQNEAGDVLYLLEEHEGGFGAEGRTHLPTELIEGCWRPQHRPSFHMTLATIELAPDERAESEYVLLDHPDSEACLSEGTYRFESPVQEFGSQSDDPTSFSAKLDITLG